MQLQHMKHMLLYNQRSRPLVVRRENAALTHEAYASIQPEVFFLFLQGCSDPVHDASLPSVTHLFFLAAHPTPPPPPLSSSTRHWLLSFASPFLLSPPYPSQGYVGCRWHPETAYCGREERKRGKSLAVIPLMHSPPPELRDLPVAL